MAVDLPVCIGLYYHLQSCSSAVSETSLAHRTLSSIFTSADLEVAKGYVSNVSNYSATDELLRGNRDRAVETRNKAEEQVYSTVVEHRRKLSQEARSNLLVEMGVKHTPRQFNSTAAMCSVQRSTAPYEDLIRRHRAPADMQFEKSPYPWSGRLCELKSPGRGLQRIVFGRQRLRDLELPATHPRSLDECLLGIVERRQGRRATVSSCIWRLCPGGRRTRMTKVVVIEAEDALVSHARMWASKESAPGCFTGAVVDYSRSCSWTPDRPCLIVRELVSWNVSLFPARMQLQEIPGERGQLPLVSVADTGLYLQQPHDFQSWLSAGLVHRLLKHRRFITSLYVTPLHFEKYTSLLSDALPHSRLKKLELKFWGFPVPTHICASIAYRTSLNKLERTFFGDCCVEFPTALEELVRTSPSLVHLDLQGTSMGEQQTKNLLTCLLERGFLEQLTLVGSVIPENCRQYLAKFLTFTASLTPFRFAADSQKTEIATLEGIVRNTTMSKVSIFTFTDNTESIQVVARIISENAAITSFLILSLSGEVSARHDDLYDAWLEAVWQTEALEEFCVPYQIWNPSSGLDSATYFRRSII